MCKLTKY